jgi:hypothetical protein
VPLWAWLEANKSKSSPYGSIPDLPDEELADPEELERQVFVQEWGPILSLPVRGAPVIRPDIDENGQPDWGAFATVDFERMSPKFDKARYKIDRLREQLRDLRILISTLRYHVRDPDKYMVLRYALRGVIDVEHILDEDLHGLVKLYRKAARLYGEIERLREIRRKRQEREVAEMFARWE